MVISLISELVLYKLDYTSCKHARTQAIAVLNASVAFDHPTCTRLQEEVMYKVGVESSHTSIHRPEFKIVKTEDNADYSIKTA